MFRRPIVNPSQTPACSESNANKTFFKDRMRILRSGLCRLIVFSLLLLLASPGARLHAQAFVHPGLLSIQQDFDRMKTQVAAGAHPWIDSYDILASNPHTSLSWNPRPVAIVYRGYDGAHPENYGQLYKDIASAYQDTLMWRITGNTAYADKAVQICNAWSSTLTGIGGTSDKFLAAGIYGYEFANAAENLSGYSGWTSGDLAQFQNMMLTVFYPLNHDFLVSHNGTCPDHYYANWDECNYASVLAIGVLCDDRAKYNEAIAYFKSGIGAGCIDTAVYQIHPGLLGQLQESGRDQGHSGLNIALLGAVCQMAWNQGDDLFGYENNRFLSAAEYFAKYNLGGSVPFANYQNCTGYIQTGVSSGSQGDIRPVWGLIYNHYANLVGIACPYTQQYVARAGNEGGGGNYGPNSGGYDQLGYTTLTCGLPPITGLAAPTGLTAWITGTSIALAWWGVPTTASYSIGRATVSGGPYMTIATGVTETGYTDTDTVPGATYYYQVTAVGSGGSLASSAEISATATTQVTGAVIGTPGSWYTWPTGSGQTIVNAFDGCLRSGENFVDGPDASGDWAGLDLGTGYSYAINQVKYCPRAGFAGRMVGGKFQGSNTADFSSGVTTLYTITAAPADNGAFTTAAFANATPFRYVRYLSPANGYLNVTELQFFGTPVAGPATHFAVSAPAATTAGSPITFTVTALDASGNTAVVYGGTVHFTTSDRYGSVPADTTLTNGVGTFQTTLGTAGTQTLTATDTATSTIAGSSSAIAVTHGMAVLLGFRVRSATVTDGVPFAFNIYALDAYGNQATDYKDKVHFGSTDPNAVLPADATLTGGQGSFRATLSTIGSQSITATDTVTSSITGTQALTVVDNPAVRFKMSATPATSTAGAPTTVTIVALDANGNVARGYAGTVHLSSNAPNAVLPPNAALTNGSGAFPVTFTTVGRWTVSANDLSNTSIAGVSGTVVVSAGAATQLSVTAASTAVANRYLSVTVKALDAYGNIATGYGGTVHLTSTDPIATLPADGPLYSGQRTFQVICKTVGSQTVTATDTANASFSDTTGTVIVTAH